ncbi:MAG TPA: phosphotransferase [Mycobacteriales bacterium]|nr:phosphotransferase [Mycobacteriales bacterium]
MSVPDPEVPLHGGTANRGLVVRIGDTVRRPARPTGAATHALLRHLDRVGFDGAPRFLGIDAEGREVLSYVPGRAITRPYPAWALTDAALTSVAALLQRYHAAVTGFDPAPYEWPPSPPAPFRGTLVLHNDPNLDNVVFRHGRAVALIDFDLASPGPRVWDVAAAVRLWAPLRQDADVDDARRGRVLHRLRLFADAYGLVPEERGQLVDAVIANHDWLYEVVQSGVRAGHAAFSDYWLSGAADRAARTRSWYLRSRGLLHTAVT